MAKALRHDGCRVIEVERGDKALSVFRTVRPSLVVLDAMLPGLHGFEICRRLKQHPELQQVPVLMVSAVYRGWENSREIHEVHGADAFLEKPFTLALLRKLAGNLLGKDIRLPPPPRDLLGELERLQLQVEQARLEGRYDDANMHVGDWLMIAPFDPVGQCEAGNLFLEQGRLEEALSAYQYATTLDPFMFGAWANLAQVYEMLGFGRMASRTWHTAASLAPDEIARNQIQMHLARA
ncbi:MAG: response regulator [Myxococcota bacterium]